MKKEFKSYVFYIIIAVFLTYSYVLIQRLEDLYLLNTLYDIIPGLFDLLDKNPMFYDLLLTSPMLFIYGYPLYKLFYTNNNPLPVTVDLTNDEIQQFQTNPSHKINTKKIFNKLKSLWSKSDIFKAIVVTCGATGLSTFWFVIVDNYLVTYHFWNASLESFSEELPNETILNNISNILAVIIIGPIVEELLFRGLVYNYLEKVKSGWFAIVVSGVLFGIFHGEPVQAVYTAMLGFVLGLIIYRTKRLELTILIHILNNLFSVVCENISSDLIYHVLDVFFMFMIIPMAFILYTERKNKEITPKIATTSAVAILSTVLISSIGIYILQVLGINF